MKLHHMTIFSGTFIALSLNAETSTDHFVDCFRSCNEAFLADSLKKGEHLPKDRASICLKIMNSAAISWKKCSKRNSKIPPLYAQRQSLA